MSREDRIATQYGERLTVDELARVLGIAVQTVHNLRSRGRFPVPTYRAGRRVYADACDVAAYLDREAGKARARHEGLMRLMEPGA